MNNELLARLCQDIGEVRSGMAFLVEQEKQRAQALADHDRRIRKLEKAYARAAGAFALITVSLTAGWKAFTSLFGGNHHG